MEATKPPWLKNTEKPAKLWHLVVVNGRWWKVKWWPGRELNPRHADFQSAALPTELPGPGESRIKQAQRRIVNYGL